MSDSFDEIYGKTSEFYYGNIPSKRLLAYLGDRRVSGLQAVDLGCGEGRNSLLLAVHGYRVLAVDASQAAIYKLNNHIEEHGITNIVVSHDDVRTARLGSCSTDAVVAVTILDHLSKPEGYDLSQRILAALKPGAFVFAEVFTVHDPGAQGTSSESSLPVSDTARFIRHYFLDGELYSWFESLHVEFYEETIERDTSHGSPHYHGVARLLATCS